MNSFTKYTLISLSIVGISSLFVYASTLDTEVSTKDQPKLECENQITARPEAIQFLGEVVPLEIPDVKERLDRELLVNTYWHSNTFLLMKRANKYFPIIEPILKKNGVPDDFKYLSVIESGLTNAVSPAGAKGFWQFMPNTGKEYGLEITNTVDERSNLELATEAACKYLLNSKRDLGSWSLVAASYNVGLASVKRRMEEQKINNYFDMYLPEETARYVFRIIAIKEIMEKPTKYNFVLTPKDLYSPEKANVIEVDTTITELADFAIKQGINYKLLKLYNPWLVDKNLENKLGKKYQIRIPTPIK